MNRTPVRTTRQDVIRVTWRESPYPEDTGSIAKMITAALARAYPDIKFKVRYRTSRTFRPSWVEISGDFAAAAGASETISSVVLRPVVEKRREYLRRIHRGGDARR
jgi:hypothetical protein